MWKVCIISGPLPPPNVDGYIHMANILHLIEPLAEEIFAITSNFPASAVSNNKLHIINIICKNNDGESMVIKSLKFIIMQLKMSYTLIKIANQIDIVFLTIGTSTLFLPALSAKLLRKKIILMHHGSSLFQNIRETDYQRTVFGKGNYIFRPVTYLLESFNCCLSDKIAVFLSDFTDPALKRYTNKLSIGSRFFVDTNSFKIGRDINSRKDTVGYFGRLIKIKGVMNFINAIPLLSGESAIAGFVVGGDGPLRDEIEKEIKNAKMCDRVALTGWIPHNKLSLYLNEVKLVVIPSYAEVGPQLLFEAMACGTPVLATPVGVVPDVIKDGETGFIMENNSPECIAKNVIRVLNYPGLDRIVDDARERIKREYTYEGAVERYREILKNL